MCVNFPVRIVKRANTKKRGFVSCHFAATESSSIPDLIEWNSPNSFRKVVRTTLRPFSDGETEAGEESGSRSHGFGGTGI